MNETISVSIILPIKSSLARNFADYFDKAIKSILNQSLNPQEVVIVHTQEESLITFLNEFDFGGLNVVKLLWDKEPNYSNQVNHGIKNAKGEWISIFEFDDEYSSIWFRNVKKYIDSYPEVKVFLPVCVDTDEKGAFAGFTNEATFAANFTQEMGYLTNETLQNYQNFQTAGSFIKKEVFDSFGGLKPSIKLTFVYDGTNFFLSEDSTVYSNTVLASYNLQVINGVLNLVITPSSSIAKTYNIKTAMMFN
mgnify:CR=1 FL=1